MLAARRFTSCPCCNVAMLNFNAKRPAYKLRLKRTLCNKNHGISKANVEDSNQIGSLLVETWKYAYKGIMQQSVLDDLSVQQRSEGWKRVLETEPEVYVLRNGKELLGVVQVCEFRGKIARYCDFSEIPVLYLRPKVIGQGFGSMLLNYAHERSTVRESKGVVLWVLEENTRAIDFYCKHGYSFSGETKAHNADLTEHLYAKNA